MSSTIWTQCGGSSELHRYARHAWRVVESQHITSTRKLVDSVEEQEALEDLIEAHKPPAPSETASLHYLLATPFRYPPLKHGSRYRTRTEPGVWYGAEEQRTTFAEVAYYRLLFLDGTHAPLEPVTAELSAFSVALRTARALDVTRPPWSRHLDRIASKTEYSESQKLGALMRADRVHLVRYPSARDVESGACVGVFDVAAFASEPSPPQTFVCTATRAAVEVVHKQFARPRGAFRFEREQFLVDGRLPSASV